MAIDFVGAVSGNASNGADVTLDLTSLTGGIASSPSEGDVVIVDGCANNAAINTAGYDVWVDQNLPSAGSIAHLVAAKVMGATPDTSVECEGGGSSSTGVAYQARVYRGVDTVTLQDATAPTPATGFGRSPNSPSITTVTDGAVTISSFGAAAGGSFSLNSNTPTGYGNRVTAIGADSNYLGVGAADKEVASAGAEDPGFWGNVASTNVLWAAATVALRPEETADELTSQDVTSGTPNIEEPSLSVIYELTSQDIVTGDPNIEQVPLGTIHNLSVADVLSSLPVIDEADIGQAHALATQGLLSSAPTIEQATLEQAVNLAADAVLFGVPVIDLGTMGQTHDLIAVDITAGVPTIDEQSISDGAADELRIKVNTYFATNNHLSLKKKEVNNKYILSEGVSRLQALGKTISDGE